MSMAAEAAGEAMVNRRSDLEGGRKNGRRRPFCRASIDGPVSLGLGVFLPNLTESK